MVFIGYERGMKGYRALQANGSIHISRVVVFEEEKSYNWVNSNEKTKSSLSDPVFASNYSVDQVNTDGKDAISTQDEATTAQGDAT